jgi:hypothetical protein
MAEYTALVGLTNDAEGTRFEPGETVTDKDFPEGVIANWVQIGVLEPKGPPAFLDVTGAAWDLAVEYGLEKEVIALETGTGAGGRILLSDVEAMITEVHSG